MVPDTVIRMRVLPGSIAGGAAPAARAAIASIGRGGAAAGRNLQVAHAVALRLHGIAHHARALLECRERFRDQRILGLAPRLGRHRQGHAGRPSGSPAACRSVRWPRRNPPIPAAVPGARASARRGSCRRPGTVWYSPDWAFTALVAARRGRERRAASSRLTAVGELRRIGAFGLGRQRRAEQVVRHFAFRLGIQRDQVEQRLGRLRGSGKGDEQQCRSAVGRMVSSFSFAHAATARRRACRRG